MAALYCISNPHTPIPLPVRCSDCGDDLANYSGGTTVDLGDGRGPQDYCGLYCVAQHIFSAMFGTTENQFAMLTSLAAGVSGTSINTDLSAGR